MSNPIREAEIKEALAKGMEWDGVEWVKSVDSNQKSVKLNRKIGKIESKTGKVESRNIIADQMSALFNLTMGKNIDENDDTSGEPELTQEDPRLSQDDPITY
jgi:hypothetical protein